MELIQLKLLLKEKTIEFEGLLESGADYIKLRELYKELKRLQYEIIQEELALEINS